MKITEKITGRISTITGITSVLGSWQVCHTVCLGIVTILGIIGITLTGMPLSFLTTIAKPVWTIAVTLYAITLLLHTRKHACISPTILLLNAGIIIAGIPFIQSYTPIFYIIGGTITTIAIINIIREKKEAVKRYSSYIIIGIILILLAGFITYTEARSNPTEFGIRDSGYEKSFLGNENIQNYNSQTTGTTGNDDVEITLTPTYNKGKISVQIAVNTHSVDISQYNIARIATLKTKGKKYSPTSAPTITGHHANGIITYTMPTKPEEFTITILGIPKTMTRTYTWR